MFLMFKNDFRKILFIVKIQDIKDIKSKKNILKYLKNAFDISGYNELIIDGERGVLFKKENSEDLAVKLDKVLGNSNYSEKLIKEGNIFSKKHDWKNLVELILNKYEEVVFRKGNKNEYWTT